MLLALKCTLMHTACRASWAWFESNLFHLCCRAPFWVKVVVERIGTFLPVAPFPGMGSCIHVLFIRQYDRIYIYLKKAPGEGFTAFKYSVLSESFLDSFHRVLCLHAERCQIEISIIYKVMGHNFCSNFRLVHCLIVQCALRTAILA